MSMKTVLPDPDLYDKGNDAHLIAHFDYDALLDEATPGSGGALNKANWNPGRIRAARFACLAKLTAGASAQWNKTAAQRLQMFTQFAERLQESTFAIMRQNLQIPVFDVNETHLEAAYTRLRLEVEACKPVDQRYQTTKVYVSYVLYMNNMRDRNEDASFIRRFPSVQAARDFYADELASAPYTDQQRYNKCFRQGGPLEWFNPLADDWWDVNYDDDSSYNQGLFERFTRELPADYQ